MNRDDVAFIDELVTEYRQRLLDAGYLSRINRNQRTRLERTHAFVLSFPALAREKAAEDEKVETDRACKELDALGRSERA